MQKKNIFGRNLHFFLEKLRKNFPKNFETSKMFAEKFRNNFLKHFGQIF